MTYTEEYAEIGIFSPDCGGVWLGRSENDDVTRGAGSGAGAESGHFAGSAGSAKSAGAGDDRSGSVRAEGLRGKRRRQDVGFSGEHRWSGAVDSQRKNADGAVRPAGKLSDRAGQGKSARVGNRYGEAAGRSCVPGRFAVSGRGRGGAEFGGGAA